MPLHEHPFSRVLVVPPSFLDRFMDIISTIEYAVFPNTESVRSSWAASSMHPISVPLDVSSFDAESSSSVPDVVHQQPNVRLPLHVQAHKSSCLGITPTLSPPSQPNLPNSPYFSVVTPSVCPSNPVPRSKYSDDKVLDPALLRLALEKALSSSLEGAQHQILKIVVNSLLLSTPKSHPSYEAEKGDQNGTFHDYSLLQCFLPKRSLEPGLALRLGLSAPFIKSLSSFLSTLPPLKTMDSSPFLDLSCSLEQMNSLLYGNPKFVPPYLTKTSTSIHNKCSLISKYHAYEACLCSSYFSEHYIDTWKFWLSFMATFSKRVADCPWHRQLSMRIQAFGIPHPLRQYIYPLLSAATNVSSANFSDLKELELPTKSSLDAARPTFKSPGCISRVKPPSALSIAGEKVSLANVFLQARHSPSKYDKIILLDINRTFSDHPFYTTKSSYSSKNAVVVGNNPVSRRRTDLFHLCRAYANYDTSVGYCQGMSVFFSLVLMSNIQPEDAFSVIVRLFLLFDIRSLYHPTLYGLKDFFQVYDHLLSIHNKRLAAHFEKIGLLLDTFLPTWLLTFFTTLFPVSFCLRLMDLLLLFGFPILYKIPLAIMAIHGNSIIETCQDFEQVLYFFKNEIPRLYYFDSMLHEGNACHSNLRHPSSSRSTTTFSSLPAHSRINDEIGPKSKRLLHEIVHHPLALNNARKRQQQNFLSQAF